MFKPRFLFLASLTASFLTLSAQIPGLPGGEEENPSPVRNLAAPAKKLEPDAIYPDPIVFPTATVENVAAIYKQVSGKYILYSSTIAQNVFPLVIDEGLTNRQVKEIIEKQINLEGYQLNPSLRNPDIVTLASASQPGPGGSPESVEPVKVVYDAAQLALENGTVTYIMKFQYLKPDEAQQILTAVYGGQLSPGGTISVVPNASSLVITDRAELIQSLVKLKENVDVASAEFDTAWIEIEYADVQELAAQLTEMFGGDGGQSGAATTRVQRPNNNNNNNTPPIPGLANNVGGGAASAEENPPSIIADSRTNRLFLMGRPVDIQFIKELVADWDSPTDPGNFLRRNLQYLPVFELIPIARRSIEGTLGGDAAGDGAQATGGATAPNNNNGNNNQNGNNNNQGGAGGAGGTGASAAALTSDVRPTQPESILVGNTLLVADNVTNSIYVQGPPHHIELVENLIDQLDVPSDQIAISAVFGRYGVTDNLSFGVNLGQLLNGNGVGFATGSTNPSAGGIIEANAITQFTNLVSPGAGLALSGVSGDFGVFVSALETYTDFTAIARPTLYTTNNREARISSGTQIAIPTSTQTGFTNAGVNTQVDFRDVVLELLVRPLVNSDKEITLDISIARSTVGQDRQVGELLVPDLLRDEVQTFVTVPIGAAVLIGGLIEEDEGSTHSGVPILRSIPLLGQLFKNNIDDFTRSELVIMVQPTIVRGAADFQSYQNAYDYSSNNSREARETFSAPRYKPRVNQAADRIFRRRDTSRNQGNTESQNQRTNQEAVRSTATSPLQKAIENKRRRLAEKKSQ